MKKLILFAVLLVTTAVFAQGLKTIAVDEVKVGESLRKELSKDSRGGQMGRIAEALDRHIVSSIVSSRKFTVVGRRDLQNIIDEQDMAAGGLVGKKAAQENMLTGAQYKLVVFLDSFQEETTTAVFDGLHKTKRRMQISAQSSIYDSTTGEILDTANIQSEKVDVVDQEQSNRQGSGRTDDLMPLLTREVAEKTVARLINALFPARIVDVDGNTITINRGEGFFAVNDALVIFGASKVVKDPDTGRDIIIKGRPIGAARIVSVDVSTAQAQIGDDAKPVVGAVVNKYQP